jgi:deazaflavin-dependent oxidoreductase (nitroreductase family)
MHVAERKGNPFIHSPRGGRALSAMMLPWFMLRPPRGFGVLTTTGRRTGRTRRKCVRAIRVGERAHLVAIGGPRAGWVRNLQANPTVRLRILDGAFTGTARTVARDTPEGGEVRVAFCETINRFDYTECRIHRPGKPSPEKIGELHRGWFSRGTPVVIELAPSGR